MTDDEAAITISLGIGLLEIVRYYENKSKPKGKRARVINDLINKSLDTCDLYRLEAWPPAKLRFASDVLDAVEDLVNRMTDSHYNWHSWEDHNYL